METVSLHETLPLFSRMVYGMWRLNDDSDTSDANIITKVETCLEQGITTMDHADLYGDYECEALYGRAMKSRPDLLEATQNVTKCGIKLISDKYPDRRVKHYDTSAAHIQYSAEQSLKKLGLDVIDLMLIHRPDPFMDPAEAGRALDDLVDSGKVRAVGVSNFKPWDWDLLQAHMHHPLVTNQIEINPMDTSCFRNGDIALTQKLGLKPMAWSPLAGGAVFGDTAQAQSIRKVMDPIAQEAGVGLDAVVVAWLMAHPAGILPVMGTNNLERIATLSDAFKVEIDRQTWFEIYEAAVGQEVP